MQEQILGQPSPWEQALERLEAVATEKAARKRYPSQPKKFAEAIGYTLSPQQAELFDSVAENRYTVVEAGHGVGKSHGVAVLTCWWLATHEEAVVITLAPTHTQVANVIWRYIRSMGRANELPGEILETPKWNITPTRFGIGLSPRKASAEDVATLQGYHSPHLLVIMDEAPGLPRILWEAVRGLAVSDSNRIIAIGNPIGQVGPFWDACNSPNWHRIRMNCLDHPNVKEQREVIPGAVSYEWVTEMVHDHCTRTEPGSPGAFEWQEAWWLPGPVFQSRVLGQAPEEASDQLISLMWVNSAQAAEVAGSGEVVIGLDPARFGGDDSAMVARAGKEVLWVKRRRPRSADPSGELAGWLKDEVYASGANKAYIDEIGIGAGVVDAARRLNLPVKGVGFGKRASQGNRFANLRAECWWRTREWLQTGQASLPADDMLAGDLTAPKYWFDAMGRVLVEPKDQINKRLGRSPDSGDALALTFAYPEQGSLTSEQQREMTTAESSRWSFRKLGGSRWRRG